ncbi:alpha/beta hydrolase [Lactiplantibacillus pentosus]|uniref:alpha/beta hydrolase n=1 Tax=Lactiplantibacillus pentosus TaxID=1589 RepID=UPI00234B3CDD|nr:alpha/beta hydrolase [Lactiplantibacillus pentosus]MDC6396782.1 alpha/beta hydrolase [Lactiplantibacillus pentosus]
MKYEQVSLATPHGFAFKLTCYWKTQLKEDADPRQWPIILIFPGSGFVQMTEREAEPIALAFSAQGYQTVVVDYNLLDRGPIYPNAIDVGLTALQYAQDQGPKHYGDAHKIILMGFSAGAHVAALTNAFGKDESYLQEHGFGSESLTSALQVMGYPVIDLAAGFPATRDEAVKISPNERYWATQKLVTAATPPTFIWNTCADAVVPPYNSLLYASALAQHGVDYEIHTFTHGKHGLCLSTVETSRYNYPEDIEVRAAEWVPLVLSWLREMLGLTHVDLK